MDYIHDLRKLTGPRKLILNCAGTVIELDGGITASGWGNVRGDTISKMYFDAIAKREGDWNTAYIITARKDPVRVQELADRLGGEIVRMSATLEQCKERIRNDPRRAERIDRYCQLAEEWYQQNEPAQQ